MGRPSKYTKELGEKVCQDIANNPFGTHKVCRNNNITVSMLMRWLAEFPEFRENYARSKEIQAEILATEIIDIADNCRLGKKTVKKGNKTEVTTGDMVERSRLMIDARKWLASKLLPKKYGDAIDVTSDHKPLSLSAKIEIINPKK